LGLSISEMARILGVSRYTLSKVVHEQAAVTPDLALRLSQAFGTSPELWLNLQQVYDLWYAARCFKEWQQVRRISKEENQRRVSIRSSVMLEM
jgi:addiction module HigA family antidote